jgi:hypothetical protein
MDSEKAIELEGRLTSLPPGTMFRVALANDSRPAKAASGLQTLSI